MTPKKQNDLTPTSDPALASASGSADDPRIAWHMRECSRRYNVDVSALAVQLALAAHTRGNQDATHDWEAHNAMSFQAVLDANPLNDKLTPLEAEHGNKTR